MGTPVKRVWMAIVAVGVATSAWAIPFVDVVEFHPGSNGPNPGMKIVDAGGKLPGFAGIYSHHVTFSPAASRVDAAVLSVEYRGTSPVIEAWLLNVGDGTATLLGQLPAEGRRMGRGNRGGGWRSAQFELPLGTYDGISGVLWTVGFKFEEGTGGNGSFDLRRSTLSGNYTPVPEPTSLLLLGSGLAGLAGWARRRRPRA